MTPGGIEPATFWFVAQHLNHCATAVPQTQVHIVNINSRTSNCQYSLFSRNNPIIRIFYLSGWLSVPISPDQWSSTVCEKKNGVRKIAKNSFVKIQYFVRLNAYLSRTRKGGYLFSLSPCSPLIDISIRMNIKTLMRAPWNYPDISRIKFKN